MAPKVIKPGFKQSVADFLQHIIDSPEDKISISEDVVVRALVTLNYISYIKIADVFLGCACINLINKYVKTFDAKLNYQFKRHIVNLLKGIEDINQPKTIKLGFDNTEGKSILLISIWDFQFSFKSIRNSKQIKLLLDGQQVQFDGIRKQPHALKIFNFIYSNQFLSNKTLSNKNLREVVETEFKLFLDGHYQFENGKLIKKKNLSIAHDITDKTLKDYFRVKLQECSRPIIISGVFAKVWEKHVTFTTIEPYIESVKSITICDHINIAKWELDKVIDVNSLKVGERYYIIGYCKPYGNGRMGVNLYIENGVTSIFGIHEFKKMSKDIISVCHRFSIEDYISKVQGELKM